MQKHCTESKLGWVQTLAQPARTGCAHCAQAGRVVGPPRPYRGPVTTRTRSLLRAMSLPYYRACRDTPQQPSLHLSRYNRLYRDTLPSGQASPSCHDTKLCIVTLTPNQAARACYRPCRGPPWPCRSLAMAVSWPWLAVSWPLQLRPGQPPQLRVTIQIVVS